MDCSFDCHSLAWMAHHFCFLGLGFLLGALLSQLLGGLFTEDFHVDRDTEGLTS